MLGIVTSLLALTLLLQLGDWVDQPTTLPAGDPGPRFWPRLLLLALLGVALMVLVRGIWSRCSRAAIGHQGSPAAPLRTVAMAAMLLLLLYPVGVAMLGVVVASMLLLASLALLAGQRRYLPLLTLTVLAPLLLYWLFTRVAGLPLANPLALF